MIAIDSRSLCQRLLTYDQMRAVGRKPRLHPNGFIQFDLVADGSCRFHVWPDEPIPAQKTSHIIHDHVFDMESVVVVGQLTNILYRFIPSMSPHYILHQGRKTVNEETVLEPTDLRGNLEEISRQQIGLGRAYSLALGVFHASLADTLTATIMLKTRSTKEKPYIAVPAGISPDNDYRRDSTNEELLWHYIMKAYSLVLIHAGHKRIPLDIKA